jgi:hypothetical protein
MAIPRYQRRVTGEMAIDPALYTLVMASATVVDRLLCAGVGLSPLGEEPPAAERRPEYEPGPRGARQAEGAG